MRRHRCTHLLYIGRQRHSRLHNPRFDRSCPRTERAFITTIIRFGLAGEFRDRHKSTDRQASDHDTIHRRRSCLSQSFSTADIVGIWVTITGNRCATQQVVQYSLRCRTPCLRRPLRRVNSFHTGVIIGTADGTAGI